MRVIELLDQYYCDAIDTISLNESVSFIDPCEYNDYKILIESVIETKDIERESKKDKSESEHIKFIEKCNNRLKDLFNWWYKVEPDKKFQSLRIVIKTIMKILNVVLGVSFPYKGKVVNKLEPHVAKYVGYKGNNALLKKLLSSKAITTHIVLIIVSQIASIITKIDEKIYVNVNKVDIDKNIDQYDKSIDDLNDRISKETDEDILKTLIKTKKSMESALAELIRIRKIIYKKGGNNA